ncbi:C45 family autoproteolytic acyltransferase/hydolase [Sneathiella chinensis]|uniref:Peptidase C45 n=1 Tax=Sneathiella chinensis TaxID=349750 RepID=A0ABQ5U197_9PROT|nr:C45 family peptidase [Sneathiella chinensis]GLQ05887.1 peptidase C45 [Sneathiella chinensis]
MPLHIINASGAPYDMGRAIGEAIADTVHRVTIHNEEFVETENRWTGSDYVRQMMDMTARIFPDLTRELEGMADGMGIAYERAFLWNCRGDLRWPEDISPAVAFGLTEGCTSLILPATPDQPATIAHNEDGSADYDGNCFWLVAKPDTGPAFESFLYPGMIPGHSMGANAAGLVQTINNVRVHDLKPGLPRHFICRAILSARTLDEALNLLKRPDRASGFHHNLGSAAENRLASVEAPASTCHIETITGSPSAHANHLIRPNLRDIPQTITHSSNVRQDRADQLLREADLSATTASDILFDNLPGHEILRRPKDGGDDYGQTLGTGIFELSPEEVRISVHLGPDHQNAYTSRLILEPAPVS